MPRKKSSSVTVRKPRLTVSPKGKVGLSGAGVRIGGRNSGLNISRSGLSTSSRVGPFRMNSRRGCSFKLALLLAFAGGAGSIALTSLLQ